jgi:hypothetical protein
MFLASPATSEAMIATRRKLDRSLRQALLFQKPSVRLDDGLPFSLSTTALQLRFRYAKTHCSASELSAELKQPSASLSRLILWLSANVRFEPSEPIRAEIHARHLDLSPVATTNHIP